MSAASQPPPTTPSPTSSAAQPALPEAPHVQPQARMALWGARALGYVVYAYLVVTEIVLALGFVLLLLGANPEPAFVQWVYRSLDRAMEPFRGIFTPIELGLTGNDVEAVLDTSVLFAMLVYGSSRGRCTWEWSGPLTRLLRLDAADRELRRRQLAASSGSAAST